MPFPCCDLCYQKYLDQDGEIIPDDLRHARTNALKGLQAEPSNSIAHSIAVAHLSEPFTDDHPPCMCDCHRHGWNVLH